MQPIIIRFLGFKFYYIKGLWFFTFFGYGIHCKNTNLHSLIFSERIGVKKCLKIKHYRFSLLPK